MASARSRLSRRALCALAGVVAICTVALPVAHAAPGAPAPAPCTGCWVPGLHTSWDWILSKVPTAPYRSVSMYDIDGFDATRADVSAMHTAGIKVVCYISAGTWENWRSDASQFPLATLGKKNGWPGEKWLDVRNAQNAGSALRSIMDARLDMCRAKGFDGVELDNVDGFSNKTGFPLSSDDQIFYNATLANDAHQRGLMVLQKNDVVQIPTLLAYFDGALNEQCNRYHECTTQQTGVYGYDQYVSAGKPVFQVEYSLATSRFCAADNAAGFNGVKLSKKLNGSIFQPCT